MTHAEQAVSRNTAQWFQTAAQEGLTVVEHTLHHLDSKRIGSDLSAQHELERVHRHLAEFRQSYQSDFEAANEAWDLLTTALSTLVIQFGDGSEELDEHQNDLENLTMDYLGTNTAKSGPTTEYEDDEGEGGREPNGSSRSRYGERADFDRVMRNPVAFIREFKGAYGGRGRNLKTLEAVLTSAVADARSSLNFSYDLEMNQPGIVGQKQEALDKVITIAALCRGDLSVEQAVHLYTAPQTVPEPLPAPKAAPPVASPMPVPVIDPALAKQKPVEPVDAVDDVDDVDAPSHTIAESESTTVAPSGSSFADQVWADRGAAWRTAFDAAPAEGRATMLAHLESERKAFKAFVQNGPPFPNAMEEFYKDRNLSELAAHAHAVLDRDKTPVDSVDSVDSVDKQPEAGLVPRLDASLAKRERLMQLLVSLLQQAPPEVDRQFVLDAMGPIVDALLQTQFAAASASTGATPQALEAAAQTAKAQSKREGLTFWASQEVEKWMKASAWGAAAMPKAFRQEHPAYKIVSMAWSTGDTDTVALRPVVIHPNINGEKGDKKWVASDVGTGMNIVKASTASDAESRARELLKTVPNALGRVSEQVPVLDWLTREAYIAAYHYDPLTGKRKRAKSNG